MKELCAIVARLNTPLHFARPPAAACLVKKEHGLHNYRHMAVVLICVPSGVIPLFQVSPGSETMALDSLILAKRSV